MTFFRTDGPHGNNRNGDEGPDGNKPHFQIYDDKVRYDDKHSTKDNPQGIPDSHLGRYDKAQLPDCIEGKSTDNHHSSDTKLDHSKAELYEVLESSSKYTHFKEEHNLKSMSLHDIKVAIDEHYKRLPEHISSELKDAFSALINFYDTFYSDVLIGEERVTCKTLEDKFNKLFENFSSAYINTNSGEVKQFIVDTCKQLILLTSDLYDAGRTPDDGFVYLAGVILDFDKLSNCSTYLQNVSQDGKPNPLGSPSDYFFKKS